ncbi:MAG: nucleoside kinase [Candidatus Riflebacteria bacterium]|nr:nucleoside kinase [Candidatus Riflebacteria bacterium]
MRRAGARNRIKVTLPDRSVREVHQGSKIVDVIRDLPPATPEFPILAARVDNKLHSLSYQLQMNCHLTLHTYHDLEGVEVYRRTLCMVLARAVAEIRTNTRLVVAHSLGNGYYYEYFTDIAVNEPLLETISAKMRQIIEKNDPIDRRIVSRPEAISFFEKQGQTDKARLLKYCEMDKIAIYTCGPVTDVGHGPLAPSTGYTPVFQLKPYQSGFILVFPERGDMKIHYQLKSHKKLFNVYCESKQWSKILAVNNVGRLNDIIQTNKAAELIRVAEALHEKKIAQIADSIASCPEVKLVLIAGPSSSGKTTFAKRLSAQLMACGIRPVALGMDDYFVNRDATPLDEDGQIDYEVLEALDLTLFNDQLPQLLSGQEVELPRFDFNAGRRAGVKPPIRLDDDQILIVEGIHGLNPKLTYAVPANQKLKIYISPLTQLSIDDFNRIPTTDTRLLRRMVRDQKYRGQSAKGTLELWHRVRRGEEKNIFPFQDEADLMFNSALLYEMAVLKRFAQPLLGEIHRDDPAYNEARRMLRFLQYFSPLATDDVPRISLLREFIGGSCFHY